MEVKWIVYTCSEVDLSDDETMCRSRGGGIGGPDPPGKSQVIFNLVSIEINILTPPPPLPGKSWTLLDPWKSIVFPAIKPLDPSVNCKINWGLKNNKKRFLGCFLAVGPGPSPTPDKNSWICAWRLCIRPKITNLQPLRVQRRISVQRAQKLTQFYNCWHFNIY